MDADVRIWAEPAWSWVTFRKGTSLAAIRGISDALSALDPKADGYFAWRGMWMAALSGNRAWPVSRNGTPMKTPARHKLQWDGRVRFLELVKKPADERLHLLIGAVSKLYRVGTGLVPEFLRVCHDLGMTVDVDGPAGWAPRRPEIGPLPDGTNLYEFQASAVAEMLLARRGICRSATGSGKGEIIVKLVEILRDQIPDGTRVLILTHLQEIFTNLEERFKRRGVGPISLYGMGNHDLSHPVVLASIPTLWRRRKDPAVVDLLANATVLIGDEIHHAQTADTWMQIMMGCNAPIRYGFTATTLMEDEGPVEEMKLISATGDIVVDVSARELIGLGHLAKPTVNVMIVDEREDGLERVARMVALGEPQPVQKPVLVMVRRIADGEMVLAFLDDLGASARMVQGSDTAADRAAAKRDLENGKVDVLVTTTIMKEGTDIPSVKTLFNLMDEKRHRSVIQVVGRSIRGSGTVNVVDLGVSGDRSSIRRLLARARACLAEGFDVRML